MWYQYRLLDFEQVDFKVKKLALTTGSILVFFLLSVFGHAAKAKKAALYLDPTCVTRIRLSKCRSKNDGTLKCHAEVAVKPCPVSVTPTTASLPKTELLKGTQ